MRGFHPQLRGLHPELGPAPRPQEVPARTGKIPLIKQRVLDGGHPVVEVALSDVEDYYSKSETQGFASHIATNTRRYVKLFSDAADQVIEDTKMIRLTPLTDQDDFENALDNFRINNYDKMEGIKPAKDIISLLKRKL